METFEKIMNIVGKHWEFFAVIALSIFCSIIIFLIIKAWPTLVTLCEKWISSKKELIKEKSESPICHVELPPTVSTDILSAKSDTTATVLEQTPAACMIEMYDAHIERDKDKLSQTYYRLQSTETNFANRTINEGFYLKLLYYCGDTSALQKLIELKDRSKLSKAYLTLINFLGEIYNHSQRFEKTLELIIPILEDQTVIGSKSYLLRQVVDSYLRRNRPNEALTTIIRQMQLTSDSEDLFNIYCTLATYYQELKYYDLQVFALEKALELKPNDHYTLFNIAYSYSMGGHSDLAYICYQQYQSFNPNDGGCLNNLAVVSDNLSMPHKAVQLYKKATKSNTLAAANLSGKYIKGGFFEEARQVLDSAYNSGLEVHSDVVKRISEIMEQENKENSIDAEVKLRANQKRLFLTKLATSAFKQAELPNLTGVWRSDTGIEVRITQNTDTFEAVWINEKQEELLASGTILNNTAKGVITYKRITLLTPSFGSFYIIVDTATETLNVLLIQFNDFSFDTLKKITA